MAQEQTAYAGDDIKVLVNVIDSTGSHVAATINTTTTRIDGNSAAPTVTTVATGIYQITFSGVTPAPAEGDRLTVKVNGNIGGTAWSEYGIPVKIVADERGTDNVVVPSADAVADAVWDEALSGHNVAGSTGKALRQIKEGVITTESSINDSSATATTFVTALTEAVDGFYHDKTMVFISGSLSGQARHIETYVGATKAITVSQPFTSAPADGDEFLILATHEHSLSEIADSVWDESQSGHTTIGTFGYYVDARVSQAATGASSPWDSLLSDYATPGTFGARFQEAARYTNTDANIIYVTRGDSYDGTANAQLSFAVTKDYSGWTGTITVRHRVTDAVLLTASVTVESATELRVSLSTSDTAFALLTTDADFGPHPYDIEMVSGASEQSAVQGVMVVRKDQTTA